MCQEDISQSKFGTFVGNTFVVFACLFGKVVSGWVVRQFLGVSYPDTGKECFYSFAELIWKVDTGGLVVQEHGMIENCPLRRKEEKVVVVVVYVHVRMGNLGFVALPDSRRSKGTLGSLALAPPVATVGKNYLELQVERLDFVVPYFCL